MKHALHYLTPCPQLILQTLRDKDHAQVEMYRRVKGQTVLLVLDNITEECMDEVKYYLEAELGVESCVILSARSADVLVKYFKIDEQSCMGVPGLKEEEAIAILLERTCVEDPTLTAEDRAFAVRCARRCSFKEVGPINRTFHPLALKALRGHLSSKYGSHLSAWVDKREGSVNRSGYGLGDLLALLGNALDNMPPDNRTIFMLLTLYIPPNISPRKVNVWLAMILNKEISSIAEVVGDLYRNAFIEECRPKIRIHELYIEVAQSKANEMRRWLWWKGNPSSPRQLISNDIGAGFEFARLEQCIHARLSQIDQGDLQNVSVLQLVDVQNMGKLDLGGMGRLRSITIHNCKDLKVLKGMENLQRLAWLMIGEVNPMFKFPKLGSLKGLQYLEIKFAGSQVLSQRADLSGCEFLREVNVCCRSLWEFPRLKGLRHLDKVEFSVCDKVNVAFDCTECVELQSTVIECGRSGWTSEYKKLSKTVLWDSDAVKAFPDIDVSSALEASSHITDVEVESFVPLHVISALKILETCDCLKNLQLWNFRNVEKLLNFNLLSSLTVLKLGKCGIRKPPDLTSCVLLEDICFVTLENLESFPNLSGLEELKNLRLYNCWRVEDPPNISGCNKLQVFHLVYNDNVKELPNMGEFPQLEEIKLSWESKEEDSCSPSGNNLPYQDVGFVLNHFTEDETFWNLRDVRAPEALREWEWLRGKSIKGIRYFRKGNKYNSITAPYHSHKQSQLSGKGTVVERVKIHPCWYLLAFPLFLANLIFVVYFFSQKCPVAKYGRLLFWDTILALLMIIFRIVYVLVVRKLASIF